mmetsp:Transcript_28752/g.68724  ORF Transcript_28752/g.68724 Transcript_28752/m.68724 type:complete len:265 (+) Transcript_28752:885-1679(+)
MLHMPAPELSRRRKTPLEENRWKLPRSMQVQSTSLPFSQYCRSRPVVSSLMHDASAASEQMSALQVSSSQIWDQTVLYAARSASMRRRDRLRMLHLISQVERAKTTNVAPNPMSTGHMYRSGCSPNSFSLIAHAKTEAPSRPHAHMMNLSNQTANAIPIRPPTTMNATASVACTAPNQSLAHSPKGVMAISPTAVRQIAPTNAYLPPSTFPAIASASATKESKDASTNAGPMIRTRRACAPQLTSTLTPLSIGTSIAHEDETGG